MTECICDSGKPAIECCDPFLNNEKKPKTAEALMRSRYAAYAIGELDYIKDTSTGTALKEFDRKEAAEFIEEADFLRLNILRTEKGGPNDDTGLVELVFHYDYNDKDYSQKEIAHFVKKDGEWFFENSEINPKGKTIEVEKTGRNDPCPCGSGKKYKKCCSN